MLQDPEQGLVFNQSLQRKRLCERSTVTSTKSCFIWLLSQGNACQCLSLYSVSKQVASLNIIICIPAVRSPTAVQNRAALSTKDPRWRQHRAIFSLFSIRFLSLRPPDLWRSAHRYVLAVGRQEKQGTSLSQTQPAVTSGVAKQLPLGRALPLLGGCEQTAANDTALVPSLWSC